MKKTLMILILAVVPVSGFAAKAAKKPAPVGDAMKPKKSRV